MFAFRCLSVKLCLEKRKGQLELNLENRYIYSIYIIFKLQQNDKRTALCYCALVDLLYKGVLPKMSLVSSTSILVSQCLHISELLSVTIFMYACGYSESHHHGTVITLLYNASIFALSSFMALLEGSDPYLLLVVLYLYK